MVSGFVPTTGISLPFFSYGGTALCLQLVEMGMVLSAVSYTHLDVYKRQGPDRGELLQP